MKIIINLILCLSLFGGQFFGQIRAAAQATSDFSTDITTSLDSAFIYVDLKNTQSTLLVGALKNTLPPDFVVSNFFCKFDRCANLVQTGQEITADLEIQPDDEIGLVIQGTFSSNSITNTATFSSQTVSATYTKPTTLEITDTELFVADFYNQIGWSPSITNNTSQTMTGVLKATLPSELLNVICEPKDVGSSKCGALTKNGNEISYAYTLLAGESISFESLGFVKAGEYCVTMETKKCLNIEDEVPSFEHNSTSDDLGNVNYLVEISSQSTKDSEVNISNILPAAPTKISCKIQNTITLEFVACPNFEFIDKAFSQKINLKPNQKALLDIQISPEEDSETGDWCDKLVINGQNSSKCSTLALSFASEIIVSHKLDNRGNIIWISEFLAKGTAQALDISNSFTGDLISSLEIISAKCTLKIAKTSCGTNSLAMTITIPKGDTAIWEIVTKAENGNYCQNPGYVAGSLQVGTQDCLDYTKPIVTTIIAFGTQISGDTILWTVNVDTFANADIFETLLEIENAKEINCQNCIFENSLLKADLGTNATATLTFKTKIANNNQASILVGRDKISFSPNFLVAPSFVVKNNQIEQIGDYQIKSYFILKDGILVGKEITNSLQITLDFEKLVDGQKYELRVVYVNPFGPDIVVSGLFETNKQAVTLISNPQIITQEVKKESINSNQKLVTLQITSSSTSSNSQVNSQALETKISQNIVTPRTGSDLNYLWITFSALAFLAIVGFVFWQFKKTN